MSLRKNIAAAGCAAGGIAMSYYLYAPIGFDENLWSPGRLVIVSIAALISVSVFIGCRVFFRDRWVQFLAGIGLSYVGFILAAKATVGGWFPLVVLIWMPLLSPVVVMCWFSSGFLLGLRGTAPKKDAPSDVGPRTPTSSRLAS